MSAGIAAGLLAALGMPAFFYVCWLMVQTMRATLRLRQEAFEREIAAARRRRAKPGPNKREQEREAIRLRGLSLARDIAAGRVSRIGPRVTLEQIRSGNA